MDSIFLEQGHILKIPGRVYIVKKDTVAQIPINLKYEIKPGQDENFYNRLAQRANKNRLTRGLHNIIIARPKDDSNFDSLKTSLSILPYVHFRDRPIRKIIITRLNVFGPAVNDTNRTARTWIGRTGNKIHIQTKTRLIRNNLLFKEGDRLKPVVLSDNERILRALPYLEDASIIVEPVSELNDSVDVHVITKDVWSIAFDLKINDVNSGIFEGWDHNILGFGQQIQNNILWDSNKKNSTGYYGIYSINNIGRSFFQGSLSYYNAFNVFYYGLSLQRAFLTPNIKYAGGISLLHTETQTNFKQDTIFALTPLHYDTYDVWAGRSFLLRGNDLSKIRRNITFSVRATDNIFYDRP